MKLSSVNTLKWLGGCICKTFAKSATFVTSEQNELSWPLARGMHSGWQLRKVNSFDFCAIGRRGGHNIKWPFVKKRKKKFVNFFFLNTFNAVFLNLFLHAEPFGAPKNVAEPFTQSKFCCGTPVLKWIVIKLQESSIC